MDFQRATLTAFFYDYPMGVAIDLLSKNTTSIDAILEPVPQLMRERFPAFNLGEYRLWRDHIKNEWKDKLNENDGILLPFLLLPEFCKELIDQHNICVKDGQLLRWREVAVCLSEDLLLCCTLAKNDASFRSSNDLGWSDVTGYESTQGMFDQGLYDLHAHLDASSDAFNIGWIDRMNRFNLKRGAAINVKDERLLDDLTILRMSQEKTIDYWRTPYLQKRFMDWVSLAAILRYKIFILASKDKYPTTKDISDIYDAIKDTARAKKMLFELFADCDTSRASSPRVTERALGRWDYALGVDALVSLDLSSPQSLLVGERWLLYSFLFRLYKNPSDRSVIRALPIFYLYILIKLRARREIIQTNRMCGLANYQQYQDNYKSFVSKDTQHLHWAYAIQTSAADFPNHIECRTSASMVDDAIRLNCDKPLLYSAVPGNHPLQGTKSFVVSISKSTVDSGTREYVEYRSQIKNDLDKVLSLNNGRIPLVQGIDITGSDRKMRPEVYGQIVRYARIKGIVKFTYHAGEDFFDLLDGIRTIDEVIYHLGWNKHCRLGHCLSLFTDVDEYYKKRHFKCFIPRQVLLDNLVWLILRCEKLHIAVPVEIQSEVDELYSDIGYGSVYNQKTYVASMKMRGDNINRTIDRAGSPYSESVRRKGRFIDKVRKNREAYNLLLDYVTNSDIYKKGNTYVEWKHPMSILTVVKKIQSAVLDLIKDKGIAIELCPTSNILIGNFDRYDQLPIQSLIDKGIPFNINTDDKGILATSIDNEYSLVHASLIKKGKSEAQVNSYIDTIRKNARKMKF